MLLVLMKVVMVCMVVPVVMTVFVMLAVVVIVSVVLMVPVVVSVMVLVLCFFLPVFDAVKLVALFGNAEMVEVIELSMKLITVVVLPWPETSPWMYSSDQYSSPL